MFFSAGLTKKMINEVCTDVVIIAQEAEVVWIQVQLYFKAKYKEPRLANIHTEQEKTRTKNTGVCIWEQETPANK